MLSCLFSYCLYTSLQELSITFNSLGMFSRVIRNGVLRNRSLVYIRESTRVLPLLWVARIPETSTRFIHFGEVNGTIDGTQPNPLSQEMNPLLQQVNTVTSFEEAINLLQVLNYLMV